MRARWLPCLAAILLPLAARAQAPAEAPARPAPVHPQGIFTHGDSSAFMEEFFGDRVERAQPETQAGGGAARKYDPAVRWDDRPLRR